ncbi:L,D-transpeptidase family protein [Aromatoleum evansii]|uniref:L,D-transpeptidase family protein n=1 Tax=Aromatoleum evansii TaxID=59406 RepID=A0ABZ1AFR0_AROEV|nr:L,D-transpeptidase family protein [Aromatoleum evansii]
MEMREVKQPEKGAIVNRAARLGLVIGRVLQVIALVLVVAAGMPNSVAAGEAGDELVRQALRDRIVALRNNGELRPAGGEIAARRLIPEFYAIRDYAPVWSNPDRRRALLRAVDDSASHGLDPSDYQFDLLRTLADDGVRDAGRLADRDLLFTEALLRLVYHLRFGKVDPRELYEGWNFSRSLGAVEPVQALEALVRAEPLGPAIELYAPRLEAYRQLRAALLAYRAMEVLGGWPSVPAGATLRAGDRDPRVPILRERLKASGDHLQPPPHDRELFDEALRESVVAFQARHGLEPDGAVGRRTFAALHVDVRRRIDQIRVNLERLRWIAQDVAGDYLLVNIAGFNARLYLDGKLAWQSRVVVGRPYRKTPAFRAEMQYLVLNPEWVIPPTILKEDVLPKVARESGYLREHDMRVVTNAGKDVDQRELDWTRYREGGFPYQIVQAAGPDNPLGRIKFMLPNPYSVYLHDTPTKKLFERSERAFSSGCIRLERPMELAVLLLDDPVQWTAEALEGEIAKGETRNVQIGRRVPVMILYHTAEVGEDGRTYFHPDLYDQDTAVLEALGRPFRFGAVGRSRSAK